MRFIYFLFFAACWQWSSCKNATIHDTATEKQGSMSAFSTDTAFQNAHEAPEIRPLANIGNTITFDTPDGKTGRAYALQAQPPSEKYLFVFHEWWGLNEAVKATAEHYYKTLNVNVLALDLYDGKKATTPEEASQLMNNVTDERAENIIRGALGFAGVEPEVATIGWCFGGGWSLRASILAGESAKGCVMYYGMPVKNARQLAPLETDILGIFAQQDEWITPTVVSEFEALAAATGKKLSVKWYDAAHAFANPSSPRYHAKAAQEANAAAMNFLKRRL